MRHGFVARFLLSAQLLSALVSGVVAQTTTADPWGGCVLEGSNADMKVKIGQKTIVCLQVANGTDWGAGVGYVRLAFEPIADQYSRLLIPNCELSVITS